MELPPGDRSNWGKLRQHVRYGYVYKRVALHETRMMALLPRSYSKPDQIHVMLRTIPFDELPIVPYDALSYNWGPAKGGHEIYVHDAHDSADSRTKSSSYKARLSASTSMPPSLQELEVDAEPSDSSEQDETVVKRDVVTELMLSLRKKHLFKVRENLYRALKTFQQERTVVTLWIDAICINQTDAEEKARQLERMQEVYEHAESVIIWLGPSDDNSVQAMKFAERAATLDDIEALAENKNEIDQWDGLVDLMETSWFSRRWVIQELALAKQAFVYCGEQSINWNILRNAISLMSTYTDKISTLLKASVKHDNDFYHLGDIETLEAKILVDVVSNVFRKGHTGDRYEPIQGLEYLVSAFSRFLSSDPRDTINAFRNIARESTGSGALTGDEAPPAPNYDAKKMLVEIYVDFVRWVARVSGKIDIICRSWALPEHTEMPDLKEAGEYPPLSRLPSWIKVVSKPRPPKKSKDERKQREWRIDGESFVGLPGQQSYNASTSIEMKVEFPPAPSRTASMTSPPAQGRSRSSPSLPMVGEPPLTEQAMKRTPNSPPEASVRRSAKKRKKTDERAQQEANNESLRKIFPVGQEFEFATLGHTRRPRPRPLGSFPKPAELQDKQPDMWIKIFGIKVGEIQFTDAPMREEIVRQETIESLRGVTASHYNQGTQVHLSELGEDDQDEVPDRLWRGLVAERGPGGREPPALYQSACKHILDNHCDKRYLETRALLAKGHLTRIEKEYVQRVQAVIRGRTYFRAAPSQSQYGALELHGFGPGECQKGDIVCIFFGCSVPCVLRRGEANPDKFNLIGECYVYGMMDGEAINMLKKGNALSEATQEFTIY